jgi:trans-aconitate methyltransferase
MNGIGDSSTFMGTAKYYAKFRPIIPVEVIEYLKQKYNLDGSGVLLDIGCGTGISTRAFAPLFAKTIAFDPNQEMLDEAISANNPPNVEWRLCSDRDLDLGNEKIKLAIAVRSFHWLNQDSFLQYLSSHLVENGAIAIIGDGSFWTGNEPWQIKTKEVIQEFLGSDRKAGRGKSYVTPPDPYDVVLKRNGFVNVDMHEIPIIRHWSLDSIIGYLYSTSFSAYHLYDGRNTEFERRLRSELSRINNNSPEFIENIKFVVQSAKYQQS